MDVSIRPITDPEELRAVEDLQQGVWGMPDRDVVPYHQLIAAMHSGGVVLGAFSTDGRLIGFCYGFVGLREGQLVFHSHLAGVLPEQRSSDVGFRLKRAQRQVALDLGIERMVWTFDPLMSLNANFNLHKLGAVARRYYVNYYGEMTDALNRGLPSDRVEVDWWLRDARVVSLMSGRRQPQAWEAAPALTAVEHPLGIAPGEPVLHLHDPVVRVQIPTALVQLKERAPQLAVAWRMVTRQVFLHYFPRGYAAVDFVVEDRDGLPRTEMARGERAGYYILQASAEDARPERTP